MAVVFVDVGMSLDGSSPVPTVAPVIRWAMAARGFTSGSTRSRRSSRGWECPAG